MPRPIRLPLGWVLIVAMLLTLAGCQASSPEPAKTNAKTAVKPAADQKLQQIHQFEQRMSSLLDQIAKQDKALSELRIQQDKTLSQAVEANKALMEEFVALRREMSVALGYEAGALPAVQSPTPPATVRLQPAGEQAPAQAAKTPAAKAEKKAPAEKEESSRIGRVILRLVILVIVLACIWLLIQIIMGRWTDEEDDEDDEDEDEDEDEEGLDDDAPEDEEIPLKKSDSAGSESQEDAASQSEDKPGDDEGKVS